jgi:hypothetical protein
MATDPSTTGSNISAGVANGVASVQNTVSNVKSSLSDFSSKTAMNASAEFLNSNSIVAKFGFLILLLMVFMFLLKTLSAMIVYFMSPSKQPYLVKGLLGGNIPLDILQDPANSSSPVVLRSNNQTGGIEFTWSVWLNISSLPNATQPRYANVFNKGNNIYHTTGDKNGIATVNNGPGLYIRSEGDNTGSVFFIMDVEPDNTVPSTPNPVSLTTTNIPLQKWFHLAYRLRNYSLECYVNGILSNSVSFANNIPKQNYNNVFVCNNGGFSGSLSNLRYYDYALSAFDITTLTNYGPNLSPSSAVPVANSIYDYISPKFYSVFQ